MRLCNIYNKEIYNKRKKKRSVPPRRAPIALGGRVLHVFEGHLVPVVRPLDYIYVFIICIYTLYVIYVFNLEPSFVIYPSRV